MTTLDPSAPDRNAQPSAIDGYRSPLEGRYASAQMQRIWSARHKFELWRRIWIALAQAQHDLGLPVTDAQLEAMRNAQRITDRDLERARQHERTLRHDVMAHVYAFADAAPEARPIIHLGATSQDINCNTEIPLLAEALELTCAKCARLVLALADFAMAHRDTPCLAKTHYQAAQPTTVGKRAATWATDLALCLERLEFTRASLRLRGVKGATGTQASFLGLFEGDAQKVAELEERVAGALGWDDAGILIATGQTYPRVVDAFIVGDLGATASALHKLASDVRLLCGAKELDEPFEESQIGSSAMPYKRNPMRSERATSLARFVMSLAQNPLNTAATQWLERTLDDSANRRLTLAESFLALDGALDLMHNVCAGLVVHEGAVRRNLDAEMPFLASERLMLEATKLGKDRQEVHEAIRAHAQAAALAVKAHGRPGDLLERLRDEPLLDGVDFDSALDPRAYTGLAPRQVERFSTQVAGPIRERYQQAIARLDASDPAV